MEIYVVGICATKKLPGETRNCHDVCTVEAHSPEEAEGMGLRYARFVCPEEEGFTQHFAFVRPSGNSRLKPEAEWRR